MSTVGDGVRCQRCTHPFYNHRPNCLWAMQGGWKEDIKAFTTVKACTCKAYVGIHPKDLNECPHEVLLTDPKTCVHCLKHVSARKR